jgi:hypothetical protein
MELDTLAFLMGGLELKFRYWETLNMIRKLVLIVIMTYVPERRLKLYLLMWALGLTLAAQFSCRPFQQSLPNKLESVSLLSLVLSINLAMPLTVSEAGGLFFSSTEDGGLLHWILVATILTVQGLTAILFVVCFVQAGYLRIRGMTTNYKQTRDRKRQIHQLARAPTLVSMLSMKNMKNSPRSPFRQRSEKELSESYESVNKESPNAATLGKLTTAAKPADSLPPPAPDFSAPGPIIHAAPDFSASGPIIHAAPEPVRFEPDQHVASPQNSWVDAPGGGINNPAAMMMSMQAMRAPLFGTVDKEDLSVGVPRRTDGLAAMNSSHKVVYRPGATPQLDGSEAELVSMNSFMRQKMLPDPTPSGSLASVSNRSHNPTNRPPASTGNLSSRRSSAYTPPPVPSQLPRLSSITSLQLTSSSRSERPTVAPQLAWAARSSSQATIPRPRSSASRPVSASACVVDVASKSSTGTHTPQSSSSSSSVPPAPAARAPEATPVHQVMYVRKVQPQPEESAARNGPVIGNSHAVHPRRGHRAVPLGLRPGVGGRGEDRPQRRIAVSPRRRRCHPGARYSLATSGQTPA